MSWAAGSKSRRCLRASSASVGTRWPVQAASSTAVRYFVISAGKVSSTPRILRARFTVAPNAAHADLITSCARQPRLSELNS